MVIVKCPTPGCSYETSDEDAPVVAALLNIHAISHSQPAQATHCPQPKLERPRIDVGMEEEVWNSFIRRWEAFRTGSGINENTAPMQLFQCASGTLGDLMLKADPDIHSKSVETVKSLMRTFAVIPVAIGVRRAELMQLRQAPDELFRTFAAKVKGKAETCSFTTTSQCQCGREVLADYTIESVRDVLLAGIADLDIRREALCTTDIQKKSINDVIAFVEGREMARNATPTCSMSALSSFKKRQSPETDAAKKIPQPPPESNKSTACPDCGKKFQLFKQRANGTWNSKPHTKCLSCWRAGRRKPGEDHTSLGSLSTTPSEPLVSQVSALESVCLKNEIMSKSELKRARRSDHPRVQISVAMANSRTKTKPAVTVRGIADSGAMSNLWV